MADFEQALQFVRPSVAEADLHAYEQWNRQLGTLIPAAAAAACAKSNDATLVVANPIIIIGDDDDAEKK